MHNVSVDRIHQLVTVRLSGFFQPEDLPAVAKDVHDAIRGLGERAGQHLTLYDVSEAQISPAATMDMLRKIFANPATRELWARKVAFVTPSALARMQAQRLREARPDIGIFENRTGALAWLLAG
jgi:hypothetical protein